MAHTLSAKKRVRQGLRRRGRNRWRKAQVKEAVRAFEQTLGSGDTQAASEKLSAAFRKLDQVAAKGTIHKNTASRKKARLARRLQAAAKK